MLKCYIIIEVGGTQITGETISCACQCFMEKEKVAFRRVRSEPRELQEMGLCGEVGVSENLTPLPGWSKTDL